MDRDQEDLPRDDDIESFLASMPRQRISHGVIGSRTVWIKRYDASGGRSQTAA